jgi:hypothetical protein
MKIMMLTVSGGTETHLIAPVHSLVAVQDDEEFLRGARAAARQNLLNDATDMTVAQRTELIATLKISLTDSGLTKWPLSGYAIEKLLEKMKREYDSRPGAR